tara:strand:+ start:968 stop:1156 length:189 start_codon:yes stop_codon:yes gene_type:complete
LRLNSDQSSSFDSVKTGDDSVKARDESVLSELSEKEKDKSEIIDNESIFKEQKEAYEKHKFM